MTAAVPARGAESDKSRDTQSSQSIFTKLDVNHDGYVDLAEAGEMNGLLEIFDQLDTNHDGKLSVEEISQVQAKNRAKHRGR